MYRGVTGLQATALGPSDRIYAAEGKRPVHSSPRHTDLSRTRSKSGGGAYTDRNGIQRQHRGGNRCIGRQAGTYRVHHAGQRVNKARTWRSKDLAEVGDIFITGIVGACGRFEPLMLQNTRLSMVMEMADCICRGIGAVENFCLEASRN